MIRFSFALFSVITVGSHWANAGAVSILESVNCPTYSAESREYEVSRLNPAESTIDGIEFPGQKQVLFRGTLESNPQFDLEKSVRGMMNEKNWFVGSPMFFGIAQVLSGQWTMDQTFFRNGGLPLRMREYFQIRGILSDIESLLSCRAPNSYSQEEAESLASNLMNKVFWNSTAERIQSDYFNIDNPEYYRSSMQDRGLGNNAVDFIIASTYDQVASIYGKKVLVLKDRRNRGLDLGYWNLKHNNKWWHHWVDNGEINIPGYIRSEDVLGFQLRKKERERAGWGQNQPNNPIDYALYRSEINGQAVILVLDGQNHLCISEAADRRYYPCDRDDLAKLISKPGPYPKPYSTEAKNRVGLMGVISGCKDDACTIADEAISWYGATSPRAIPSDLVTKIQAIAVNGIKLKLKSVAGIAAPAFSGIKVVSATFMTTSEIATGGKGNVTDAAARFVNGKDEVEYKISGRFLRLHDRKEREFRIEWICPNNPANILRFTVPAPAEGKTFHMKCDP